MCAYIHMMRVSLPLNFHVGVVGPTAAGRITANVYVLTRMQSVSLASRLRALLCVFICDPSAFPHKFVAASSAVLSAAGWVVTAVVFDGSTVLHSVKLTLPNDAR